MISIHALREESDGADDPNKIKSINFNPRSPRGERRFFSWYTKTFKHFNPRSPRGERLVQEDLYISVLIFQSTLSARRATQLRKNLAKFLRFQSTLSARRATLKCYYIVRVKQISIHALREESDCFKSFWFNRIQISIHALREESDSFCIDLPDNFNFISIHALREESDSKKASARLYWRRFQSTLSARRAT